MRRPRWADAARTGLIFGVIEAITPVAGWMVGSAASRFIQAWDHWIAFGLLCALGSHAIYRSCADGEAERATPTVGSLSVLALAVAGLATSIDALAVGVGLAFVDVHIGIVAAAIGLCTFTMVSIGVMAGHALGALIGRRAEAAGGAILIVVGTMILYEHVIAVA